MDFHLLIDNLTNPALLYFVLGILAVKFKSDLEIPFVTAGSYLEIQQLNFDGHMIAIMALAVTFPFNITFGMPIYLSVISL